MGQIPINKYIVWLFLSLPVLLQAQADSLVLEVSPKLNDGTLWRQETKIHPGRLMAGAVPRMRGSMA